MGFNTGHFYWVEFTLRYGIILFLMNIGEGKMEFVYCVDANFVMFERDELIAQKLVELKETKGYPNRLQVSYAKNEPDRVFRINKLLTLHGIGKGATLSLQSLSPQVLKNIGRRNMDIDYFASQLKRYRDAGMHTYTDLILGLPGETFESFFHGLFAVIEAGQCLSINIYRCELLPNSLMNSKEILSKYKIKTIRSFFCQNHSKCSDDSSLGSRSELVVETDTMSRSDWRKACRISACVQSFHCMGLLRFFAVFLRTAKNIPYYDFYMSVCEWIEESGKKTKEIFDYVMSSLDDFYDEIAEFLKKYFDDEKIFRELLTFQKHMITKHDCDDVHMRFDYGWLNYFDDIMI